MNYLFSLAGVCWRFLRELTGENDYARYCGHAGADGAPVMTAEQFYLHRLRQKYSRINRCC